MAALCIWNGDAETTNKRRQRLVSSSHKTSLYDCGSACFDMVPNRMRKFLTAACNASLDCCLLINRSPAMKGQRFYWSKFDNGRDDSVYKARYATYTAVWRVGCVFRRARTTFNYRHTTLKCNNFSDRGKSNSNVC